MEWVVRIVAVALVAWGIWTVAQSRYAFVIRIENGRPSVRKGKVTRGFLGVVSEVCRDDGVPRGWIGGVPHGNRVALRFSTHFPPGTQQRLRNQWQVMA